MSFLIIQCHHFWLLMRRGNKILPLHCRYLPDRNDLERVQQQKTWINITVASDDDNQNYLVNMTDTKVVHGLNNKDPSDLIFNKNNSELGGGKWFRGYQIEFDCTLYELTKTYSIATGTNAAQSLNTAKFLRAAVKLLEFVGVHQKFHC